MELTFHKTVCPCLRKVISQVQMQEQTQEVRLPDSMPDIGRVLDSWGQVLLRGKEWRGNAMMVSGGVMTWVLYAAEGDPQPQSVEVWIPFQMRWEFPQTQRDGTICVLPLLKSVDARSTSARKMMVRANVSLLGEAMEPVEAELSIPENVPEDIQLLKAAYPLELPKEAGEKLVSIEEELVLPGVCPPVEQILRYAVAPKVLEQKVMAGRLVFRGKCATHMLYTGEDGALHTWDTEVPFSQYAELDRDYSSGSSSSIIPTVTNLELMLDEQKHLQLKCSIAAQYQICDRVMTEIVEDAYSPVRPLKLQTETMQLPVRLDQQEQMLQLNGQWDGEAERIVDVTGFPDHPQLRQEGEMAGIAVPMQFQMLYYDPAGNLQSGTVRCEQSLGMLSDPQNSIHTYLQTEGWPQGTLMGQNVQLTAQCQVNSDVFSHQGLSMVSGITAGEMIEPDPCRPSLILRRKGKDRLWDIAKECGSTVDGIWLANGLDEEPEADKMLLIPIS